MAVKIPNDLLNRLCYLGMGTDPLTRTPPTHRVSMQPDITTTYPLLEDDEATGTFMTMVNPQHGLPEHTGTWGVVASYENIPSLLRAAVGGGSDPAIFANPAFTYQQAPIITHDESQYATVQYNHAGDIWEAMFRFGQFNIEGSAADANAFWRIGGNLVVMRNDQLAFTEVTSTSGTRGTNEVQEIDESGTVSGGTRRLFFRGYWTTPLAYTATAGDIEGALEALASIGVGNVSCTGGPMGSAAVDVEFVNDLGNQAVPLLIADDSALTGSTPGTAITVDTAGNSYDNVTMSGAGWDVNEFQGAWVFPHPDTNKPGARQIVSNTADTFTVSYPFDVTPTGGQEYLIAGLPVAGLPALVEHKIPFAGTKLYIDPVGGTIGTTQILTRFIGFNVTLNWNLDAKTFGEDTAGPSGVFGHGECEVTAQIRLEADRPDEWRQLKRLDRLAIRIEHEGPVIAPAAPTYLARIDLKDGVWTERSKDERNQNLTQTLVFKSRAVVPPVQFVTRNGVAYLP